VNFEDFLSWVNTSDKYVLVEFGADWCKPCKAMKPLLDRLKAEYDGMLDIRQVNVEEAPDVVQKLNIRGVPTLVLLGGGGVLASHTGALTYDGLRAFVEEGIA
jgi:thioredoxin 1